MAISSLYTFLRGLLVRNSDGTGNNLLHPEWGSADHAFVRVTPNSYLDGKGAMELNPSPRLISNEIMAQPKDGNGNDLDIPSVAGLNEFHQFFGQFLTHDIAEAPLGPNGIDLPISLEGLPFPFNRTPFEEVGGVRQQHNEETSFLDLSATYGRNTEILNLLRDDITVNGTRVQSAKLLSSGDANNLLPTFQQVADDSGRTVNDVRVIINGAAPGGFNANQYATGDNRANQNGALLTHQTMWMREHNWQVDRLAEKFPTWSQNQLFEAARAITEAEWQHVVYEEYLPKLLGEKAIRDYKGYKLNVDPSVINEWTTVAFRFGHDQSSNIFSNLSEDGAVTSAFTLGRSFQLAGAAIALRKDLGGSSVDEWIRGQLAHATQEIDGKIVDGNRNALFGIPGATVDLNVFDIQRARDHGVGNYNELREGLGLKTYASFDEFAAYNGLDYDTLSALKSVYGEYGIGQLDSIVGGLLEKNHKDSQLGETFTKLTVMQFERLRDGDRFYYENRFKYNKDLIDDIESTSLSDIIARTSGIEHIYHDAFAAHERIGGTGESNSLYGTGKADLIFGLGGNDTAKGGNGNDDLCGDYGDDHLYGEKGKDLLKGGMGKDWLDGGADKDKDAFVFDSALGASNVDTVRNFTKWDEIYLDKDIFKTLKEGTLSKTAFHISKTTAIAADKYDRIVYQEKTGYLFYDPDGNGSAQAQLIAKLDPKLALNHQDFVVIG
jgi:Ca2+-binding RTX toxin-like protein